MQIRILLALTGMLVVTVSTAATAQPDALRQGADLREAPSLESAIITEMNQLRRDPAAYANKLRAMRPYYEGALLKIPKQVPILTQEGVEALDEAIEALERARAVAPLQRSEGLARAAMDHVADLGKHGHVGHFGSDGSGPADRATRHGQWRGSVAENITFGSITASEVVIDLLIDDGVANRGHRKVMLGKSFRRTGVSCGWHPTYRQTCVITYADGFDDNAATRRGATTRVIPGVGSRNAPPRAVAPAPAPRMPEPVYVDDEIIEL